MVNTISNGFCLQNPKLPWLPPQTGEENDHTREIQFRIWSLTEIQAIAEKQLSLKDDDTDVLIPITRDCSQDIQNNELTHEHIAQLILDLGDEDYINSQWCLKSTDPNTKLHPNRLWVPCDAYGINTVETDSKGKKIHRQYYIKMSKNLTGALVLLISCHPSTY